MNEIMKAKENCKFDCPRLLINSCHESFSDEMDIPVHTESKLSINEESSSSSINENSVKLEITKETINHVSFQKSFKVMYLGYAVLDRRYTQPMLPWLIAEIKRHGSGNEEHIFLEITDDTLKAVKCENDSVIFEHKLQSVSKFAQSTLDATCFTYMTKEVESGPSAYHVFQAFDESSIFKLFKDVKERSKELANQHNISSHIVKSSSHDTLDSIVNSGWQYEVLYLGRIKVSGKRAPPCFIDDAVEKFHVYELEKAKNCKNLYKQSYNGSSMFVNSHNSVSVDDLKDAELQSLIRRNKYDERLNKGANCDINPLLQSPLSPLKPDQTHIFTQSQSPSNENHSSENSIISQVSRDLNRSKSSSLIPPSSLIAHTQSLDAPGCADIIRDLRDSDPGVILRDRVRSCSGDIPCTKQTSLPVFSRSEDGIKDIRRPRSYTSPSPNETRQKNRTMLFLIGPKEIYLIGTDKKQILLCKKFSDISHCSQGVRHLDHFGFICREVTLSGADCYSGYIFRCQTEKVVDEMMLTLKQAFSQAHQSYQKIPTKPSKIPEVFNCDSCPMHWYHKLCCDVEGLSAEDAHLVILEKLGTLPDSVKEEVVIKFQKKHSENVQEQNEVLMMLLREIAEQKQLNHSHILSATNGKNESPLNKEKTTKLDFIREKARKSLSSSIETFMKLRNKDEVKESTLYSTHRPTSDHQLSAIKDLDSRSYREGSYDGERISSEHIYAASSRPRSSTFTSSREVHLASKKLSKQENTQNNKPKINMFMKASNQGKTVTSTPKEAVSKGSWRQAIFQRVQTNVTDQNQDLNHLSEVDGSSTFQSKLQVKRPRGELRALWKKIILEQIILIRMEKENRKLQDGQNAATHKRMKLNYEEITPCIKSAVVNWEKVITDPKRNESNMDRDKLIELVKTGIPRSKRGDIWQYLSEQHKNLWPSTKNTEELNVSYEELLKQLTSHQHSILIDIGRTFPNHPFYSQTLGSGQLSLFNLLKAYSLLDKEVGYCQGLSFVAGILLLHMPEEPSFSMMKYLMFDLGLRRQYKTDMVAFQIQMYQLSRLLHDNYRDLYDHLEKYDISPTLYAAPWFLTLFASQFPLGFVSRLFDLIFLHGMDVVFKISLLLLGNYKDYLLSCDSFESCMNFLKTTLPSIDVLQMEIIFTQAFNLDISRQLHAYEVEYHVLSEETVQSAANSNDEVENLKSVNKALKSQYMELMEQLQVAYSRMHSLEASEASLKSTVVRLEKRVALLEDEKEALSNNMRFMRNKLKQLEASRIEISGNEEHPPPFAVVYALAGSEREEDEQFHSLMKSFCQNKEREHDNLEETRVEEINPDDIDNDVFENLSQEKMNVK